MQDGRWINIPLLPPIIHPSTDTSRSYYGIDINTHRSSLTWFPRDAKLAYYTSLTAFSVDMLAAGISGIAAGGSLVLGALSAEDFAIGYFAGAAAYQEIMNPVENILGVASFGLTSISDLSNGNMSLYARDNGYQLKISSGASIAGFSASMGLSGATGTDPTFDTIWNNLVLAHDIGLMPRFNLVIQTLDSNMPQTYIELVD